ncbi:M56 family metallopeptidase [Flaviaesturariibacter amylovorans]|uniref:Peptidase M56 domain-containing protein n=1 Tax=Flaviaesturariibacter amylovorans TaxID=1084520 RepID=A0ABP8HMM3_9BACT
MNTPFLSDTLLRALLWTLVYSLPLGLLAAALAGAVVAATRSRPPALRYNALLAVGASFLLATAAVFLYYYGSPESGPATEAPVQPLAAAYEGPAAGPSFYSSWAASTAAFIDRNAALLLGAWALLFALRAFRLAYDYRSLHVLRSRALAPVAPQWEARLEELCGRIGLRGPVPLFESGLARVPMIVGYLKPVLLVPAGFFSGLPSESVEAILLHELAHLRRRDHLVNGLQHAAELLFFFNPAVLWLSRLLRTEREHCCDDLAVQHSGNTRSYINALVAFQEHHATPLGALAFADRDMPLLDRIKRLIHHQNKTLNTMEKTTLLAGLLAITLVGSAFYQQQQPDPKPAAAIVTDTVPIAPPLAPGGADTSGKRTGQIQYSDGNKTYRFEMKEDKLTGLSIDGTQVPADKLSGYESLFRKVLTDSRKAEAEASRHRRRAIDLEKEADRMRVKAEEMRTKAAELKQQVVDLHADAATLEKERREHDATRAEHERTMADHARTAKEHEAMMREHQKTVEVHELRNKEHQRLAKEHEAMARIHEREAQVHRTVHDKMVAEGLIKEGKTTSISFDDDKLIINGVTQPAEVAARYRKLIAEEKARLGLK